MAQPGGSNSSEGRCAYKKKRKHDYRGWTSSWSTFTNAWLHIITLTAHITWFVSVFCDDCSVSSTLRCRLILKFLSRWASFCCTSRWWNDSLGNKVLGENASIYMYKQVYYKNSKKIVKVCPISPICKKVSFFFFSVVMSEEKIQRTRLDRTLWAKTTHIQCLVDAIWNWATLVKITIYVQKCTLPQ